MRTPRPRRSRVDGPLATAGAALVLAVAVSASAGPAEAGPAEAPDAAHTTLSGLSVRPSIVAVGSTTTGTITRRIGNMEYIRLRTSNAGVATVPSQVTMQRRATSQSFEVKMVGEVGGCATITASDANSSVDTKVYAYPRTSLRAPFQVRVSPTAGTEPAEYTPVFHGSALTGTVSRSSTSGSQTLYLSSNTSAVSVPRSVTFPIGSTSTSFRVMVSGRPDCAVITASDGRSVSRRLLLFVDVPA